MDWYIAKLVFQIIRHDEPSVAEFDVQLRLIFADEKDWALEKATTIGRLDETSFKNSKDQLVTWKFVGVTEINCVGDLDDTLLLHSESEVPANVSQYTKEVRMKMMLVNESTDTISIKI
jgi:hypothetical protein